MQSKGLQTPAGREATQGRDAGPPGRRVDGVRRRAEPSEDRGWRATLTKSDAKDSTGVVEVKPWLENSNGVFMAERRAACRYALFLTISWLYSPVKKTLHRRRVGFESQRA